MRSNLVPLHINWISESIYCGFGDRLSSWILDLVFVAPFFILTEYLNSLGKNIFFYTLLPNILFDVWYYIYLPMKHGGTPGKLINGLKIIKVDGQPIGWKEAIIRNSVMLALTILGYVLMTSNIIEADNNTFVKLGWLQRSHYLNTLSPVFYKVSSWATNLWILSQLVVLLTNKRRRAVHDFMAGTVIVKTKYVDKIVETMTHLLTEPMEETNGIDLLPHYAD